VRQALCQEPDLDLLAKQWGEAEERDSNTVRDIEAGQGKTDLNVEALANGITFSSWLAKDAGGRLYYYDGGVYIPYGESFIAKRVKELYRSAGLARHWSTRKTTEVVEYKQRDHRQQQKPGSDYAKVSKRCRHRKRS
jgi:hypothetical protein